MNATSILKAGSKVIHPDDLLDPRIFAVIDGISDDVTYHRIVYNVPYGLDAEDTLLVASLLNRYYPPTDTQDIAYCLGDGAFTVIINDKGVLEWEGSSTRYDEALEWIDGPNAFEYTPADRVLITALQVDGTYIQHISCPTEEMMLTAVQRTSIAIVHIKNPSDAIRRAAAAQAAVERPRVRVEFTRQYGPDSSRLAR